MSDTCDEALLAALRAEGLDTVEGAFAYEAGADLVKHGLKGRRRTRLEVTDAAGNRHELYMKRYADEPCSVRWKRCWAHRRPCSAADVEFSNIRAARAAGVPTMQEVLFGEQGRRSYVIVSAVPGDPLERCGEQFLATIEQDHGIPHFTTRLADLVATLHEAGYVHRDLYASHVFLDKRGGDFELFLIDLARMFRPLCRRFRWRVKDLAQLKYSMPTLWTVAHWDDFLAKYLGGAAAAMPRYARAIDRKVAVIRRHDENRLRRHARRAAP